MSDTAVSSPSDTPKQWLPAAQSCWLVLAGGLLVLWLIGQPALFRALHEPCAQVSCQFVGFTPEQFRVLRAAGITPVEYAILSTFFFNVAVMVRLGVGLLIFVRRGDSVGMLIISFAIASDPLMVSAPPLSVLVFGSILMPLIGAFQLAGGILFYAVFFIFPDGRFVPHWTRWTFYIGIVDVLLRVVLPPDAPINDPGNVVGLLFGMLTGSIYFVAFGAQVYRYRHISTPRQRQQSKWAVLGLLIAGVSQAILVLTTQYPAFIHAPAHDQAVAYVVSNTFIPMVQMVIPLSIGAAILRSHLWDIDVIIRRTLIYGTLTALLASMYFVVVILAQLLGARLTNQAQSSPLLIVVTTLLIAALVNPLRRGIQAIIDRRFYRRKYDAARTVDAFAASLRTEVDLTDLTDHLLAVVEDTMQPAHVSLWLCQPTRREEQPARRHG